MNALKHLSCIFLLFFTVSATVFTEASKVDDGTYPYNTFMIPFAVEALKLLAASAMLAFERLTRKSNVSLTSIRGFWKYSIPAFCYFVSNNCMFYIIRHLGATTFQIMNNLKVLSTGVFMHIFLGRRLTWMQWKALIILTIGSMVTQLRGETDSENIVAFSTSPFLGYTLVIVSALSSGAGGVFSEKLLKDEQTPEQLTDCEDEVSIHWKNIQLYLFGVIFGIISLRGEVVLSNVFDGFNTFAYATVGTLAVCGLLVSFILKYLDNVAKCFCAALSMTCVAILDASIRRTAVPLRIILGVILTVLALEQYTLTCDEGKSLTNTKLVHSDTGAHTRHQ